MDLGVRCDSANLRPLSFSLSWICRREIERKFLPEAGSKKGRKIHYSIRRCEMSFCVPNLSLRITKVWFSFSFEMGTFQIPRDITNYSYYYSFTPISCYCYDFLLIISHWTVSIQSFSPLIKFSPLNWYTRVFDMEKIKKKFFFFLYFLILRSCIDHTNDA